MAGSYGFRISIAFLPQAISAITEPFTAARAAAKYICQEWRRANHLAETRSGTNAHAVNVIERNTYR